MRASPALILLKKYIKKFYYDTKTTLLTAAKE